MEKERMELQGHVSDMLGATDHILQAIKRQLNDSKVQESHTTMGTLRKVEKVLTHQCSHLEQHLNTFGAPPTHPLKDAYSQLTGFMAGMYDKLRPDPVSRMLRDDYTALNLAVVSNSMLHVTALALRDPVTASLALEHMGQISPLIVELGEIILPVVVKEVGEDHQVDKTAANTALVNVREVWKPEHVRI